LLDKQYQQFIFHELYTQYPYPVEKENTTDRSTGTVVSQGVVRGRIRLVHNLEEAQFLEDGDIMVCQYTDIGWTPYFSRIAGLITEIGSALSHGAVIAREYGLPAVVNYSNALQIFENGQLIELNTENNPPVLMVE
jgi:pyruvate,water dikinase